MTTTVWNIKLLGNLNESDFDRWVAAAKIPTGYHFDVSVYNATKSGSYWDVDHNEATPSIPQEENTIIISGREGVVDFGTYCYDGGRCTMMAQKDDFTTGTELLALMLTCDGLLDKSVLNKLMDTVDLGNWIKKNQPSALPAYNNMNSLMGSDGYIDDDNPEGEKLKNAMCQYVVKVLGVLKTKSVVEET